MMDQSACYAECSLTVPASVVDPLSDALMVAGALAVTVEDADADTPDEQPIYGEPGELTDDQLLVRPWQRSRVLALFQDEALGRRALAELANFSLETTTWQSIPEQDWVRLTQSQFQPIQITPRLHIVPSWHENTQSIAENLDAIRLLLDPGLAFGTGSHPTTRLCLRWLAEQAAPLGKVLDYGCGSGILAIAALKLGASSALGVDIDPQAIRAAEDNAQKNHVPLRLQTSSARLAEETFNTVVANILANPLIVLAPTLCQALAPGASLVLSGILSRQAEAVQAAYAPWLKLDIWQTEEDWVCMVGHRLNV